MFALGYISGVLSGCFIAFFTTLIVRILNKKPDEAIIPYRVFNTQKAKRKPLVQDDDKAYQKERERGQDHG